jgi:hypothetical protein
MRNAMRLEDRKALCPTTLEKLEAEAALPNAWLADDTDDLRAPRNCMCQRRFQSCHLVQTADEA